MFSSSQKVRYLYVLLILYGLGLPFIEYYFFDATRGSTGILLVVAASLFGLYPGLFAAIYAGGILVGLNFFLKSVPTDPWMLIREMFIYAILTAVVGLVVKHYKISRKNLADSITDLQNVKVALKESQQRMMNIINFLPDATFVITSYGRVIAWNKAIEELTGVKAEKMLGKDNYEYSYVLFGERKPFIIDLVIEQSLNPEIDIEKKYPHVKRGEDNTFYGDTLCSRARKKGGYLWTKASPLYSTQGFLVGAIASLRDVTDRKQTEEKLKFLSFHDKLTGLYNRAFFEEELKRLNNDRQLPLSVIMGDVNGLKMVNDTFGHQQGDKLLIAAARCIKSCCRKEDIICRWGGDEFSILLPNTGPESSQQICQRIKESCAQFDKIAAPLSISIGTATKESNDESIFAVIKKAEDLMYRNKLLESQNARGSIVPSLQKLLEEKTEETVEHASRLNHYALEIGRALGLTPEELHELTLLSALHDLGKIAIPDSIILKADKLTDEEWEIMKKHSEIGYNMTKSIPELTHISRKILHHHEWWNGEGYPDGLASEEIPLLSRIITVVDAYDVMTSGRTYKKSLTPKKALRELQKFSGTHFEPSLVKIFIEILKTSSKLTG
jgi:diguanylate cyclase (GGDEF)-like protein/PAS domain S-box-containing protein